MRSFRLDPYLWIHLAGIAAVPILLELCFLGLTAADPILPIGLEFLLVAGIGIAPIAWMQWQRPFYIFSFLVVALRPDQLTEEQRKMLRLFKTLPVRGVTVLGAVALAIALWKLFQAPPLLTPVPLLPHWRLGGLAIAAIAFLLSNLFLQVPASVLRVLLAKDPQVAAMTPYAVEQVAREFTLIGLPVRKILPEIVTEPAIAPPTPAEDSDSVPSLGSAAVAHLSNPPIPETGDPWEESWDSESAPAESDTAARESTSPTGDEASEAITHEEVVTEPEGQATLLENFQEGDHPQEGTPSEGPEAVQSEAVQSEDIPSPDLGSDSVLSEDLEADVPSENLGADNALSEDWASADLEPSEEMESPDLPSQDRQLPSAAGGPDDLKSGELEEAPETAAPESQPDADASAAGQPPSTEADAALKPVAETPPGPAPDEPSIEESSSPK